MLSILFTHRVIRIITPIVFNEIKAISIFDYGDYRSYLREQLLIRMKKNPEFSLRAFSRHLGISPSFFSRILSGQRILTSEQAHSIGKVLKLSTRETQYLELLILLERTSDPQAKAALQERQQTTQKQAGATVSASDLSIDAFRVVSEWYHVALLEMTELTDFDRLTETEIARKLAISTHEVRQGIERLLRLELLEKNENGNLRKTHVHGFFKSQNYDQALRRFHRDLLEKALTALDEQGPEEAIFGSYTFSIDPELLPQCKKKLADTCVQLSKQLSKSGKLSRTYNFVFGLTNLTHRKKEKLK